MVQPGKRDYKFRNQYGDAKLEKLRAQPMRTLWGVMRQLEHTDKILDVVKIDREGPRKAYEPPVIRNLLEDGTYAWEMIQYNLKNIDYFLNKLK